MNPQHDPDRDAHLLAALRHAPDRELAPPAELSARILAAAREAVVRGRAPRASAWQRLWGGLDGLAGRFGGPQLGAAFATLALATLIGVMWSSQEPPVPVSVSPDGPPAPAKNDARPAATQAPAPAPAPAPALARERRVESPSDQTPAMARDQTSPSARESGAERKDSAAAPPAAAEQAFKAPPVVPPAAAESARADEPRAPRLAKKAEVGTPATAANAAPAHPRGEPTAAPVSPAIAPAPSPTPAPAEGALATSPPAGGGAAAAAVPAAPPPTATAAPAPVAQAPAAPAPALPAPAVQARRAATPAEPAAAAGRALGSAVAPSALAEKAVAAPDPFAGIDAATASSAWRWRVDGARELAHGPAQAEWWAAMRAATGGRWQSVTTAATASSDAKTSAPDLELRSSSRGTRTWALRWFEDSLQVVDPEGRVWRALPAAEAAQVLRQAPARW